MSFHHKKTHHHSPHVSKRLREEIEEVLAEEIPAKRVIAGHGPGFAVVPFVRQITNAWNFIQFTNLTLGPILPTSVLPGNPIGSLNSTDTRLGSIVHWINLKAKYKIIWPIMADMVEPELYYIKFILVWMDNFDSIASWDSNNQDMPLALYGLSSSAFPLSPQMISLRNYTPFPSSSSARTGYHILREWTERDPRYNSASAGTNTVVYTTYHDMEMYFGDKPLVSEFNESSLSQPITGRLVLAMFTDRTDSAVTGRYRPELTMEATLKFRDQA